MILFENISTEHQIIQADLGQTVTLSCLFDPEKIDQVRLSIFHRIEMNEGI